MSLFLSCHESSLSKTGGVRLHVEDLMGNVDMRFDYMCETIYACGVHTLKRMLSDIEAIQNGDQEMGGGGSDAWGVDFDKNGAVFEFDYAPEGEEIGGEVSLAQFKLAVQTYLQFLEDPERKPITIAFPEK
jgi:hypothetical protein